MKRVGEFFDQVDLNKDGYLSMEDYDIWIENLKKEVKADPALMEKTIKEIREFWGENVGLKPGVKLTKEQYLDVMAEVCLRAKTDYEKGNRDSSFFHYQNVIFDVVDTNRNGFIELEEYEKLMSASYFGKDVAKIAFDAIDTNHDGKLSREELMDFNQKFWLFPDNEETAGLFGQRYE